VYLRSVALLLALGLVTACGRDPAPAAIPPDTFVAVNVALRTIPDTVADRDSARAAVLEAHGVEEDELLAFLAAHEGDLELLATTWREIATRVDSIATPAEEILPGPEPDWTPYDADPDPVYEEPAAPHREPSGYRPPQVRIDERMERLPPPPSAGHGDAPPEAASEPAVPAAVDPERTP
jgi:hypothetical protein